MAEEEPVSEKYQQFTQKTWEKKIKWELHKTFLILIKMRECYKKVLLIILAFNDYSSQRATWSDPIESGREDLRETSQRSGASRCLARKCWISCTIGDFQYFLMFTGFRPTFEHGPVWSWRNHHHRRDRRRDVRGSLQDDKANNSFSVHPWRR